VGTAAATWNPIVTDHLGTPIYALTTAGAQHWLGGFEPFGRDYQQGSGQDSLTKGVFLRLPGQWDDTVLGGATLGADVYYNVHRWYESGTGRYTRFDPIGLRAGANLFGYALMSPTRWYDHLGLDAVCCTEGPERLLEGATEAGRRGKDLASGRGLQAKGGSGPVGITYCGAGAVGTPGTPITLFEPVRWGRLGPCEKECARVHEGSHASSCRQFGQLVSDRLADMDEALAYTIEGLCLLKASKNGEIDAEKEFPDLSPLPEAP